MRGALAALLLLAGCDAQRSGTGRLPNGPGAPPASIYVTVVGGGALRIGDRPTTVDRLAADLRRLGAAPEQTLIRVRLGDGSVSYEDTMAVFNALAAGGFSTPIALVGEAPP